jgi:hypothetical protein
VNAKIFTKKFWNQILEFDKNFSYLEDIIGFSRLSRKFDKPESLSNEIETRFFNAYSDSNLSTLNRYFQNLKKLYVEYLKIEDDEYLENLNDDSDDEDDSMISDDEEEEEANSQKKDASDYKLRKRDILLFKVLDLAHFPEYFEILLKIFTKINSFRIRSYLKDYPMIESIFNLIDIPITEGYLIFNLQELKFIEIFKLEKLFKNKDLYLNLKMYKKAKKELKDQKANLKSVKGKIKFTFEIMNQKYFMNICKETFMIQEKLNIYKQLRSKNMNKWLIIHSGEKGDYLETLSLWFNSKLFSQFLMIFLYFRGYKKKLKEKMDNQMFKDVEEMIKFLDIKPLQPEKIGKPKSFIN